MKKLIWIVLILAIIIIALFASSKFIVTSSVSSARNKAFDAMARSAQSQLGPIVELYYSDHKTVPATLSDLRQTNSNTGRPYIEFTEAQLATITYTRTSTNTADICLVSDPAQCKRVVAR